MKNIYLCGFMGCGKSTVGRLAAKQMSMKFLDLDEYIEKKYGCTIPEIFEQRGEQAFRALETETLRELATTSGYIIATGGGTMVSPLNAEIAKQNGSIVFLDLPFDTCYERIAGDSHRPVVQANSRAGLLEIFNYRVPLYRAHATYSVDASQSPQMISKAVKQLYD